MERRVDYDIRYIDSWTIWLDIQIILRTAFELLRPRRALLTSRPDRRVANPHASVVIRRGASAGQDAAPTAATPPRGLVPAP